MNVMFFDLGILSVHILNRKSNCILIFSMKSYKRLRNLFILNNAKRTIHETQTNLLRKCILRGYQKDLTEILEQILEIENMSSLQSLNVITVNVVSSLRGSYFALTNEFFQSNVVNN